MGDSDHGEHEFTGLGLAVLRWGRDWHSTFGGVGTLESCLTCACLKLQTAQTRKPNRDTHFFASRLFTELGLVGTGMTLGCRLFQRDPEP